MAALIPTDQFYLDQVAALTNGADRPTKSPAKGGTLKTVSVQYTLLGTEAATDTLALAYLPKNVRFSRVHSYVESLDPGTTLTLDVGTVADPDNYADGIILSNGAGVNFSSAVATAPNLVPVITTDNTLVQATIVSAAALTAGVILYFTLAYTDFN